MKVNFIRKLRMKSRKRKIDLVVLSDIHLGTYGSHARELYEYLRSIKPATLILNGDIIDIWQFSKHYWPPDHMRVVKEFLRMASKGTRIIYITGNHDEMFRKFSGIHLGNIEITNMLEMNLNGERVWFFHGDVFDVIMQHSRWLEKLGSKGYDFLVLLNVFVNFIAKLLGRKKVSLSRRIKENVKTAVKYIGQFEITAARLAIENGFQSIVCGHIHYPEIRKINTEKGSIMYLNSGDWIENLTALEYTTDTWKLYKYGERNEAPNTVTENEQDDHIMEMDNKEVFKMVMKEFQM